MTNNFSSYLNNKNNNLNDNNNFNNNDNDKDSSEINYVLEIIKRFYFSSKFQRMSVLVKNTSLISSNNNNNNNNY